MHCRNIVDFREAIDEIRKRVAKGLGQLPKKSKMLKKDRTAV